MIWLSVRAGPHCHVTTWDGRIRRGVCPYFPSRSALAADEEARALLRPSEPHERND